MIPKMVDELMIELAATPFTIHEVYVDLDHRGRDLVNIALYLALAELKFEHLFLKTKNIVDRARYAAVFDAVESEQAVANLHASVVTKLMECIGFTEPPIKDLRALSQFVFALVLKLVERGAIVIPSDPSSPSDARLAKLNEMFPDWRTKPMRLSS